ncbi:tyrosine-type recombinase/integrase [Caballeronia hypogeia]|uniref:tyrosine-type recombinase/integrase n=1 Tax=Caballeronia hypogeia TaxID=1777140 RepID=UPI0012FDE7CA|nr:tyrosine-type recombinase/integrase [Caballeronia hypogeia]
MKQDFIDWISDQKDAGYADATINRKTNGMRGVFSLAVDAEVLAVHPMSQVKKLREPSGIVRFLHDDEDARLHAALDAREHALRVRLDDERAVDELRVKILVSLNTGVRRGELLRLELEHIDLIHRTIAVIDGNAKSGTRRFLPLNGALRLQDDDLTSLAPAEILDLQMRYKAPRPYDASKPIGEQVERADRLQRQTVQLVMERCRTDDELILLRRYLSISPPETKDPV